jgi:hypothetical protein
MKNIALKMLALKSFAMDAIIRLKVRLTNPQASNLINPVKDEKGFRFGK